ncbi:MAG: serine hydrolase [Gemmatimonadales bacterium]|jgi:CubicO group peptidase (beta-lactamase class C family)
MPRFAHAVALLPLLALIALPGPAPAQTATAVDVRQYEEVLTAAYPADEPGAAALVARDGVIEYLGASGMASLELGVPLEPDMVFEIGSITKQFTAAAIMMLAEEGRLSFDDPMTKFLPDYPEYGDRITVEHLLTHTSGIVSYTNITGYMAEEIRRDLTVEELVDVFKDLPVEFEPGERFSYNNSGYVLLGAIIESASGMTYAEFLQERIFDRLGMKDSYYGSHRRIIPRRASGYGGESGAWLNAAFLSMTQPYSAGALMMTVEDLFRWNQALYGGELISETSLERMTTPYVLNNGDATSYGYGLAPRDLRGRRAIGHGGGINGYVTDAFYLPEADVFVAVFSNSPGSPAGPNLVAGKLGAIAIGDPYPVWREIALDEATLSRYAGVYRIDENTQRVVTVEDGQLYTQRSGGARQRAYPSSETHFFYKHSLSHFEFVVEGGETYMLMYQGGAEQAERAVRVADAPQPRQPTELDPSIYDDYVGVYELEPGFDLTVTRDGDRLIVQATGQSPVEILPESETEFFVEEIDAQITFVRSPSGSVDRLILHQGGRDIPAERKSSP